MRPVKSCFLTELMFAPLGKFYQERLEYEEAKEILLTALKSGVNVVDTAPWYGNTRCGSNRSMTHNDSRVHLDSL